MNVFNLGLINMFVVVLVSVFVGGLDLGNLNFGSGSVVVGLGVNLGFRSFGISYLSFVNLGSNDLGLWNIVVCELSIFGFGIFKLNFYLSFDCEFVYVSLWIG